MSVKDIAKLGKLLAQFLASFACCFARPAGRMLLQVYVQGLLSDVQRKNVEAIALDQRVAPRTLQRFLESIIWDEQRLRDRCQQFIATDHAHPEAIGCIDETGTAKSGNQTDSTITTTAAKLGDVVIVDGMFCGEVLREFPGGQFVVTVIAPEPFTVSCTWDGDARSASTNEPLMVSIDGNY